MQIQNGIIDFVTLIAKGDLKALARAISLVENSDQWASALLKKAKINYDLPIVGITGPPGAGKSSLLDSLLEELVPSGAKIAIVAIDPSSPFNYGALLGDRLRLNKWYNHENVYIRSLASRGALGGLSEKVIEVTDLIRSAPFDWIFVETVGVGQSEVDIAGLSDTTVVVLGPQTGDYVQAMKAGILEIADIFVINKWDQPGAKQMMADLKKMLHLRTKSAPPVLPSNAINGEGAAEIIRTIKNHGISETTEHRTHLLARKAINLIRKQLSNHISQQEILNKVKKEVGAGSFNLYQFIEQFTNKP